MWKASGKRCNLPVNSYVGVGRARQSASHLFCVYRVKRRMWLIYSSNQKLFHVHSASWNLEVSFQELWVYSLPSASPPFPVTSPPSLSSPSSLSFLFPSPFFSPNLPCFSPLPLSFALTLLSFSSYFILPSGPPCPLYFYFYLMFVLIDKILMIAVVKDFPELYYM